MKRTIIIVLIVIFSSTFFLGCSKKSQISVSVIGEDGNPLQEVSLAMGTSTGKTDNSGKFTFKNLISGDYMIVASKDGYDSSSTNTTVVEKESKLLTITLEKSVTFDEINNINKFPTLNSYTEEIVSHKSNGSGGKLDLRVAQKGKQVEITILDYETKRIDELYIDGSRAKARDSTIAGNTYAYYPSSNFSKKVESTIYDATGTLIVIQSWFNDAIKNPSENFTAERAGNETINGYFTTKYVCKEKTNSGAVTDIEFWKIISGTYKNYVVRMITTCINSDGGVDSIYRIDLYLLNDTVISSF